MSQVLPRAFPRMSVLNTALRFTPAPIAGEDDCKAQFPLPRFIGQTDKQRVCNNAMRFVTRRLSRRNLSK